MDMVWRQGSEKRWHVAEIQGEREPEPVGSRSGCRCFESLKVSSCSVGKDSEMSKACCDSSPFLSLLLIAAIITRFIGEVCCRVSWISRQRDRQGEEIEIGIKD